MSNVNANMTGNIAILSSPDRRYLEVLEDNKGLAFREQKINDRARFTVKQGSNNKIQLVSLATNKYVNMYYINDVKCEGDGGGLSMGIVYLTNGLINLTITGYQGQDGRTAFLSNEAGNISYNGSLAVRELENENCRFIIENL
ncbi:hypothetical protein B0H14DRAFT_2792587 [Mycena olivaceomarginata]|nr:hypothetical protein B0H14DRAFT_2792587 [Mycena olivaceomarginata]